MTGQTAIIADTTDGVNGPEDALEGWAGVDWRTHEDNVRRLRQRIFKATRDGDLKRVRELQKLILRSRSNTLISVRQVTQRNAGRKTAGIDGIVVVTSRGKMELAEQLQRHAPPWKALPVKREAYSRGGVEFVVVEVGDCADDAFYLVEWAAVAAR